MGRMMLSSFGLRVVESHGQECRSGWSQKVIGAASSMFPSDASQVTSRVRASTAVRAGRSSRGIPRAVERLRRPVPCGTTRTGNQGRLEIAARAAPAEGMPRMRACCMDQLREAHHTARPLHSPEGATLSY
jgi:hypothetical protein